MIDPKTAAAGRIACPRCRANNFAGTTHCWQCRAPLPPPESAGAVSHAPPAALRQPALISPAAQPSLRSAPTDPALTRSAAERGAVPGAGRRRPGSAALAAVALTVGLLAFLAVWVVMRPHDTGAARPSETVQAPRPTSSAQGTAAAAPTADEPDPIVVESKRFIERESRHLDLPNAPTSPDGRVHLRGGGSISPDEYRNAQRHVQDSPMFHQPLPPPPMP